MQDLRKLTYVGRIGLLPAVALVGLFFALGYGFAFLSPLSAADPTSKLWLLLGLGLLIGWSNGASP
jgi:hypothetical protein